MENAEESECDSTISDAELLSIAREEAHRTIDHQIDTLDDIDDKAARILRLNLLLIGILLTGFSIAATDNGFGDAIGDLRSVINWYLLCGLLAILASTALAAFTYTTSSKRGGMSGRDIANLLTNDHTPEQNLRGILEGYSIWMQYNYKMNTKNAPLGTGILILLFYGLVLVSVGVYHGIVDETGTITALTVLSILAVFTWKSGVYNQLKRYWRYRKFDPTES